MNSHRLPRTVVPSRYDIRLEPDLDTATYVGEETIQVEVRDEVDEVQLNAVELTFTRVEADGPDGSRLEGAATLDSSTDRVSPPLSAPVSDPASGRCASGSAAS